MTPMPPDTAAQYARPTACPACKQFCPKEDCGLLTLSASQLGAILGLIFGAGLYFAQSYMGGATTLRVEREDIKLFEQFWTILLLSGLYYAIAEWVLEERDYIKLRRLRKAKLEFWLRVSLAVMFGVAVAGAPEILRFGLAPLHASFFLLAIIYLGFLFWDVLIAG